MRTAPLIALLMVSPVSGGDEDLLRFRNGDQLHGAFAGFAEGSAVLWKRDGPTGVVKFKNNELREVVLRGGHPATSLGDLSHIGTVNGDRLPGAVRKLDEKSLFLETKFGGLLEVPRNQVGLIAPSSLGGRMQYNGPFEPSGWLMKDLTHPEGTPGAKEGEKADFPQWKFSGSAWYWQNEKIGTALIRKSCVPDRALIGFDMAWKNRLLLAVAFHADFARPPEKAGKEVEVRNVHPGQPASLPALFGRSYVLQLSSGYVALYRTGFDEQGRPLSEQLRTTHGGVRLGDSGTARVELRCSRISGEIILFIDGGFVAQWSEGGKGDGKAGYNSPGEGLGFLVQADDSPVRLSEIQISEWNGMPDAARSMQAEETDIVLLANGTDRFSGTVSTIEEGVLSLEGRYGKYEIPLPEIAEIRFAKSRLAKPEVPASGEITIGLHPIGHISGKPVGGDGKMLSLLTGFSGEIELTLDPVILLGFQPSESFLDDWDVEF